MTNSPIRFLSIVRQALINLPRGGKASLSIVVDLVGLAGSSIASFWLVKQGPLPPEAFLVAALVPPVVGVLIAWYFGLYRSIVRYMGLDLLGASAVTAFSAGIVGAVALSFYSSMIDVVRWGLVFFALALIFVSGIRYFASLFLAVRQRAASQENVLIYGAGSLGAQLVVSLRQSSEFVPVAILDDDPEPSGHRMKGLNVYHSSQIGDVVATHGVSRILLALPKVSRRKRRKILERLSEHPVHVQTIPEIDDIVSGKAKVDEIKDVDVKDLLGRDSVPPNEELLRASITGKSVMVTGAGGSIGSELCRQVLALNPRCLVMLEISEPSLYAIDQEIKALNRESGVTAEIIALLGSVHHEDRVREAIQAFKVNTVFHAAAYKHVPIVEHNLFEGIHNNILGTLHAARAARDAQVDLFVLISTDKAVNPTNVMGATKRMSEMILQAVNGDSSTTFSMVRFGNVLASSGSVVPLFKQQILNGGPVTVTHRDIIRYFMTIPEAAQLVIQAGSMATGGDVFVLDMGKPVKIHDLAVRMINLMGMTVRDAENPEGDIEIQFVGLRPAEKLYEELLIGSNVTGTEHPRILRADEEFLPKDVLDRLIDELVSASRDLDCERAKAVLMSAVEEYEPTGGIEDHVWRRKQADGSTADPKDRVIEFPKPS